MKQKIAKFLLFVYTTYVQEEWEIYNRAGKFFIYPAWFIRSFFIWLLCPLLIPEYLLTRNKVYLAIKAAQNAGITFEQLIQMNRQMKRKRK